MLQICLSKGSALRMPPATPAVDGAIQGAELQAEKNGAAAPIGLVVLYFPI
jgi:hypothetical protein